jgi:hypothetical protein
MESIRIAAQQNIGAVKARLHHSIARAMGHALAIGLVLTGLGFGVAGATIALAAKFGAAWAFCGVGAAFLVAGVAAWAATGALRATARAPAAHDKTPPSADLMAASEIAFLLGFVAIRALLPPAKKPTDSRK